VNIEPIEILPHVNYIYLDGTPYELIKNNMCGYAYAPIGVYSADFEVIGDWTTPAPVSEIFVVMADLCELPARYDDNHDPDPFDILSPPDGSTLTVNYTTVSWEASGDQESGLGTYEVHLISHYDRVENAEPSETSIVVNDLMDGDYVCYIDAADRAGNITRSISSKTFTVAASPPEITVDIKDPSGHVLTVDDGNSEEDRKAVAKNPIIEAKVSDGNGVGSAQLTILDSGGNEIVNMNVNESQLNHTLSYDDNTTVLTPGEYSIIVNAHDESGASNTLTIYVEVFESLKLKGEGTYPYPNPFRPGSDELTLYYDLTEPSVVTVFIYDVNGKLRWKRTYIPPDEGAHSNINKPKWDGRDMFGKYVANGPYYYFVVSNGKVLGKGEIAAYR